MTEEEINQVLAALNRKVGHLVCPMCSNNHEFDFNSNYIINVLNKKPNHMDIEGGKGVAISTVPFSCKKCGFLSQHNIDFLLS